MIARAEWEALGTSVVLLVVNANALGEARTLVERELKQIDWACSRFRADSELSRANAHAGRRVTIDLLLAEAIDVALRAARLTDGDVNPAVGRALELAGYDRDWRELQPLPDRTDAGSDSNAVAGDGSLAVIGPDAPSALGAPTPQMGASSTAHVRAIARPGWEAIQLDRERRTVRVPRGVKLDLGATAKAWAADRASRAAHEATGCGVLVSLGGDISTCGPAPDGGWRVRVTDDHRAGASAPGQTIALHSGGLATSSVTVRRWAHNGEAMHHIIDPRTHAPCDGPWRTVSVAAADCVDANIASTAALVRGATAPQWLGSLGVHARLVRQDGDVLTVGLWPAEAQQRVAA